MAPLGLQGPVDIQRWIDLRAAVLAGLLSGGLFCVLELGVGALASGETPWTPLRMMAAIAVGQEVAEGTGSMSLWTVTVALSLHFGLSVIYACVGSIGFHRLAHGPAMLLGIVLGFLLYMVNYFGFAVWFDWFAARQGLWPTSLHVLFGIFTATSYHLLRRGHWRGGAQFAGPAETHLRIGGFPIHINWNAALWAALVSGTLFLILEMVAASLLEGHSLWRPVHMIAGIALGADAVPPIGVAASFTWRSLAAALLVHFTLSLTYSTIGGILFRQLSVRNALVAGLMLGMLLYAVNFYVFAQVFEWFKDARGWPVILVHAVYGVAVGASHKCAD